MFLNDPESMSNETWMHFPQQESLVYKLGLISREINETSMENSNSGIFYPKTFSNESISQNLQQSTIPLIYQASISNEIFTDFTEQQKSVYDPLTTTGDKFSYGLKEYKTYLNFPGQRNSENNSSSEQRSSPFLHTKSLKSSESISNDMQPSTIPQNYSGSISNESFTHFMQRETSVNKPVEKISSRAYCGKEQSRSYWNYPGSIYSENNSSTIQHSITSMDYPVSNSTECPSYNMYGVIQEPTYHLGVHAMKNISYDSKNTNSSFANLDNNLGEFMCHDMIDSCLSFNYYEISSNDAISFENHETHSAFNYPETTSKVYKTNDMLNYYISSNFSTPVTPKRSLCDIKQSNGSLFSPGFTSTETVSSDEQYSQPNSNTSSLNFGENISHNIRNTISGSADPGSMYQESISHYMENTTSSFCIPGHHSNTNNSFNLQQSNSVFYHPDSLLKENDSQDMQTSSSSNYSTELHRNVNNFLETHNSRTSLYLLSTKNKNVSFDSSQISYKCDNILIKKNFDKSNENNTVSQDIDKNNDKIAETQLNGRKNIELIQKENGSRQRIFVDWNIQESKITERTSENKIFALGLEIKSGLKKNQQKRTFKCEYCNKSLGS
ncbi:hypothetical protein NPIL_501341, partial [Nephila pilipes]